MKKRIVSFLCLIIMLAICLASCKEAVTENGNQDDDYPDDPQNLKFQLLDDGSYAVLLKYAYMLDEIIIPASYNGKAVTRVINPSPTTISNINSVKSIIIPDTVTALDNYAFLGFNSLKAITIPDSVTFIGNFAFMGCISLESIIIPDSITYIGYSAFDGCDSLTGYEQNDTIYLGNPDNPYIVLLDCSTSSQTFTIPDSVIYINNIAFFNCASLEGITVPSSVKHIGVSAFENCSKLKSITIPYGVSFIGGFSFYRCSSLESVTFENPEGWSSASSVIPASDLQNTATAATHLTSTYLYNNWTKATE